MSADINETIVFFRVLLRLSVFLVSSSAYLEIGDVEGSGKEGTECN
jgi:hypothetical protein